MGPLLARRRPCLSVTAPGAQPGGSLTDGPPLETLIRYSGVSKHQPAIDVWLSQQDPLLAGMAREWFTRLRRCGDDVCEVLHDRFPRRDHPRPTVGGAIACVTDAPFAYVNVFRHHVNVGFYQGASLDDPAGLLEGSSRFMRHVKLRPGKEVDVAALKALIDAAYADMKARLVRELAIEPDG
jgi:hypothetical protein